MPVSVSAEQFRVIAEIGGDVAWVIDCGTGLLDYISASVEQLLGYAVADVHAQLDAAQLADQLAPQLVDQLAAPPLAAQLATPLASPLPAQITAPLPASSVTQVFAPPADLAPAPLAALCAGLQARLARLADGDLSRLRLVRQFDVRHRDGHTVPLEVVSRVLIDASGQAASLVGIVRDLGAQRARETRQHRFTSMLNHEFRTPLSSIDGAIQRLEAGSAGADAPTRKRYRRIADAVERMVGLLDTHLSPERLGAAGAVRPAERIDPHQLLEDGAALVRAAGRSVTVTTSGMPDTLRCAPQGLRMALQVLVANALQYGPAADPIVLTGRRLDGGIVLMVRDHGAGVPRADIAHIFAKSVRGSNAGTLPGSGLGLYMARAVVEVHGGTLGVRNVLPSGAEFCLWLPLREAAGKPVASVWSSSDNPVKK